MLVEDNSFTSNSNLLIKFHVIVADSDLIMKLTALLSTQSSLGTERQNFPHAASQHSVVKVESSDADVPSFEIIAVVDPASEEAQQIIPLVMVSYLSSGDVSLPQLSTVYCCISFLLIWECFVAII